MDINCLRCKGRGFCGKDFCHLAIRSHAAKKILQIIPGGVFSGTSPAPFIGRAGYPYVNIGILSPPEQRDDAWLYDAPRYWGAKQYSINEVLGFRASLINSRTKADSNALADIIRQIGMSSAPVDLEIGIEDRPRFAITSDSVMAPHGPSALLRNARITTNPRVHPKVERIVSDTDLGAAEGMAYLHSHGFDENMISKLFSVGALGVRLQRKMVPTRWSITASDEILSSAFISKLKENAIIDCHKSYYGSYLGNHYIILLFPEVWGYELFEIANTGISQESAFCTDHEVYSGRKQYASNCAGGYYSVRLALAEKLSSQRKQARALVIRVITSEYSTPLGVWVTREAARKALEAEAIIFDSRDLMLKYTQSLCRKKFGLDISGMLKRSILIMEMVEQRKLDSAF